MDAEGNAGGIIAIPSIENTFHNKFIHVLHDIPKQYIYEYLISKLIISEATIQNIILQNVFLLLIWGDVQEIKEIQKIKYNWAYQLIFIPYKKLLTDFI